MEASLKNWVCCKPGGTTAEEEEEGESGWKWAGGSCSCRSGWRMEEEHEEEEEEEEEESRGLGCMARLAKVWLWNSRRAESSSGLRGAKAVLRPRGAGGAKGAGRGVRKALPARGSRR